jgi:hypothetical protein
MEFAEDYDLWETFQYLPGAESLKFQRRARFDPCPMSPSDWKLHVGTFTSREGEREEIVRTHLSNREGKHGTSTTPRFYLTSGKRLIMSELRLVKFFEPFGIVSTLKGLRFTERINLLILFYYLERGVMGQLSLTRKEVVTIMKACREIAEVAKNNGGEPCRKRETAEEALKRGFRIELPSEPEGEDYADPPPPYEHKHINQIQSSEAQGKAYETEDVTWKPAAMVERQRPLIPSCADSSSMCSEPRLQQLEPKLSGSQEAYPNQIRYLEPKSLISVYQSPKPTIYGTDSVIALTPDAQFDDPEQIPDSYVHLKRRIFSEEGHGDMKSNLSKTLS